MIALEKINQLTSERKHQNLLKTLRFIWQADKVNRNQLAKSLGLSKVSIGHYIDELLSMGMIVELDCIKPERSGSRPISIQMKDDVFYTLGIALFRGNIQLCLLNARNEIIAEDKKYKHEESIEAREKCEFIMERIDRLILDVGINQEKLLGIGIAVTGVSDPVDGTILYSGDFPDAVNLKLCNIFERQYKIPCMLINTSHTAAYIEKKWGKAKDKSTFLYLSSGFGLGMMLDSRLFRGHQHQAGEAGMVQLESSGEKGMDGREGLLSTLAPFYKITDTLEAIIEKNGIQLLPKQFYENKGNISLAMVVDSIESGNQLCANLMSDCFNTISRAVINFAYLFNPEVIYLPDWTSRCPEVSIDIVQRMMGHYGVNNWKLKTEIESAALGDDDLAHGAGSVIVEKMLKNDNFLS